MRKTWAIFKREYLQVVRKKFFLIVTLLTPFLLGGMMFFPALLAMRGLGEKNITVVDGTGRLKDAFREEKTNLLATRPGRGSTGSAAEAFDRGRSVPLRIKVEYLAAPSDPDGRAKPYLDRLAGRQQGGGARLDGVLVIPAAALDDPEAPISFYRRSSADLITQERLGHLVNQALTRERLTARGMLPGEVERLLRTTRLQTIQVSRTGEQRKGGQLDFIVAFLFVILLLLPTLFYGQEIMRGIVQEKTDRIVEILISSMSPMQLLSGKILGLAAVGLTQVAIWFAMAAIAAASLGGLAAAGGANLGQFLDPRIVLLFFVFYLMGYLIYVCMYSVAGAVSTSEKEAQQVLAPVILLTMVPWMLAMPILQSPDSRMAVSLSFVPIFTPITMFMRVVVSEPPAWQIACSILLSLATIYVMFWITAKIFRVGILSYGKRPTIPELWRWMKVA